MKVKSNRASESKYFRTSVFFYKWYKQNATTGRNDGSQTASPSFNKLTQKRRGSIMEKMELNKRKGVYTLFKCGFSQRKINPEIGSGIPGNFFPPPSQGVDDDLMTKVAYFNDGEKSALIVVADFVEMYRSEALPIRKYLAEKTGIDINAVMFCGTHTHSGGMVLGFPPFTYTKADENYLKLIRDMSLEAAQEAMETAKPAKIGYGVGKEETVSFNRRFVMTDGKVKTNPGYLNPDIVKPEGSRDPDVAVLRVDTMDGKPIGMITNFAAHGTAHTGPYFSADYPAGIAQIVSAVLGEDVVSLFVNGACGNVITSDAEGKVLKKDVSTAPGYYLTMGRIIGLEALKTRERIQYIEDCKLDYNLETVFIRKRIPSKEEYDKAMQYINGEEEKTPREEYYAASTQVIYEDPDKDQPMPADVQVISVGGVRICAFPAELFYEYAIELKEREKDEKIMVATIANGVLGYVPTRRAFKNGGYEPSLGYTSRWEEVCGEKLVEAVIRQIDKIKERE